MSAREEASKIIDGGYDDVHEGDDTISITENGLINSITTALEQRDREIKELDSQNKKIHEILNQEETEKTILESKIATLRDENKLMAEQLMLYMESSKSCSSCGLLLPNHDPGCGRWQKVNATLREQAEKMAEAIKEAVGLTQESKLPICIHCLKEVKPSDSQVVRGQGDNQKFAHIDCYLEFRRG